MTFPCTRCGLCCHKLGNSDALAELDRGDGVCIYYEPSIGCTVYDERPLVCRIDEGYDAFASDLMSLQRYYRHNAEVCNQLQAEADLPSNWRVKL
ncbi:hypothetical protein SAHY_06278 [Salinisphaera hydrothermalis EPR70]